MAENETKQEWLNRMTDMLGVDEEDILDVVEMFFDDVNEQLADLKTQYEAKDHDTFIRSVHSLKGSAGNVGFNALSNLARDLEIQAKTNTVECFNEQLQAITEEVENRRTFVGM